MKQTIRRGAALGLALVMTVTAAAASNALGWDVHKSSVPISQGTTIGKNIFWSDTYSDLRTEYYVSYTPNQAVTPTVAYGEKVLSKATLSAMAQSLESQGKRVVSGLNGDWYVVATGATTGLVVTDGVVRATPYYTDAWAIGFNEDGTAFIAQTGLTTTVSFGGQTYPLTGAINKVRQTTKNGVGGLTLLTSDFAATTQNTQAGVDVVLTPVDDGTGSTALSPAIGQTVRYTVDQVLESTGALAIPEGKAVLTMNAADDANILAALRALLPGDEVTLSITSSDQRWNTAVEALGGVYKIVTGGQIATGLDASRTACSAIGIKADGTLVFYAMDGGQPGYSVGATLSQVAQRLVELGCVDAISMDGGGSTTIGATYPDKSGMQVVNKPSGGSQRSNSTAIFLTTTLQPTGELAGYYVTPSDQMLLSGAQLQLSAAGVDSSYYLTEGEQVSWTVSDGGGTVSESGLFTAGAESGFSQVTADDGTYSGTAYLTTVKTPDSISLTNEATGAAVTALNLDPNQQVDLKATAVYRKLTLTAQDTCFTWSVEGNVGTVDQNGLFTAGSSSGTGSLIVSAGGKSATFKVTVAGHVAELESCEGDLSAFTATTTAAVQAETGLEHVHNGRQSLKLTYQAGETGIAALDTALTIPQGDGWLGMWVYGDGSGNTLMATAGGQDAGSFLLTALDFTGWQYVMVQLPEHTETITQLSVVYGGGEGKQTGTIWLDQLVTANEHLEDTTPPQITLKLSGTQLTATVSDSLTRTIPQDHVTLTYDGESIPFTWNESAGTLSASLPAADTGYHRVTLTAWDAAGNPARASADLTPSAPRVSPFGDMTGHWAEAYATFLYDQGISQGTGGEVPQYQPDRNITRAEFLAMVAHWLELDLTQYSSVELPFADKDQIPDWAMSEMKAVYALGLLQGAESASGLMANPNATITRAEAITLLGRTQAKGYAQAELTAFTDAGQVADWAAEYMGILVGQGVVTGSNGQIRPGGLLTRGEVAKLLYAML